MEERKPANFNIIKSLPTQSANLTKILFLVLVVSVILGGVTGYILSSKTTAKKVDTNGSPPKSAAQDTRTFRDFAEGTIKPNPKANNTDEYVEGTHFLEREGAPPVALTSSVVDLSKYEGKKIKVHGETQKAIKEGWLMDVGKVEEIN